MAFFMVEIKMKDIRIKYLCNLKAELKSILREKKDSLRIWFNVGYDDHLVLERVKAPSVLYPDLLLLSIKYYEDQGDDNGEKLWKEYGNEYFLEDSIEAVVEIFMNRLISDNMQKASGKGFTKKECVSAHHIMMKSK